MKTRTYHVTHNDDSQRERLVEAVSGFAVLRYVAEPAFTIRVAKVADIIRLGKAGTVEVEDATTAFDDDDAAAAVEA